LEQIILARGKPKQMLMDNGSEFISKDFDRWAYENNVTLNYSRPGKPTDNPFIESFNGSFRDECLNVNWFLSMEDAEEKMETWRNDYNHFRPHSSLNNMTPIEFIKSRPNSTINSV
jgi:putative transposase